MGEIENVVPPQVRAHSKASHIMIHLQHILIRIPRIQEQPRPHQHQHRRRQLVIPAQHAQIRDHIKRLRVPRHPGIRRQRQVRAVSRGVEQPRRSPHVLVVVPGRVVVGLDERVAPRVAVAPPTVPCEGENGNRPLSQFLGVGVVVAEDDGGGRHGRSHLTG